MLEDKIDMAANGIKKGIGWIRENKGKILGGALVGGGTVAGIGFLLNRSKEDYCDEDLYLEECEYDILDDDDEASEEIEIDTVVTIEEKED